MASASDSKRRLIRVAVVGTGTEIGKTHVSCALLRFWSASCRVVGLKPIETGVGLEEVAGTRGRRNGGTSVEPSDQERLAEAARVFHVKQVGGRPTPRAGSFHVKQSARQRGPLAVPSLTSIKGGGRPTGQRRARVGSPPLRSLFAFSDPVSPHLAARDAGVRIDLGAIERWVADHQAPITVVETAGALFSPVGYGTTNFDLVQSLRPDIVVLVAPDRLGVLHDLTTTLALAAARGGPELAIVLSGPARSDTSTGRNAAEIEALGIGHVVAEFPRAAANAPATTHAAERVDAWMHAKLDANRSL
ncbi:MAG: dethiobiotin synthase [Polyangiaceae bacterium]